MFWKNKNIETWRKVSEKELNLMLEKDIDNWNKLIKIWIIIGIIGLLVSVISK